MSESGNGAAEWRRYGYLPFIAALGYATSVLHVYSIGPFIEALQQDFGWTRARITSGITVAAFISAFASVPVGMLIDRLGPRRVGLVGAILMCGAFALLGTATGTHANWTLLWVGVAVGTFFVQATTWTSAVASRFTYSRGLALAITLCGASFSATVFPLISTTLIEMVGWRKAFFVQGLGWGAVVFPLLFLLFRGGRDTVAKVAVEVEPPIGSDGAQKKPAGVSLAEGLRLPALYKLLLAGGIFSFTAIGVLVHFVPILKDHGADPLAAAGTASLIGIFSIAGRLGTGVLLDRLPAHWVGAVAFLIPITGCALLLLDGSNPLYQTVAAISIGLTVGSEVDVIAYLAARHFGLANFGALYGALTMALQLGTAFGPLTAGAIFDHSGSYAPFLTLAIGLMTVSVISMLSLGHPPAAAGHDPNPTR